MCLAESLQLPVPKNLLQNIPGLDGSPQPVLINLDELLNQISSGALDPEEYLAPVELATYQQFKYQKRKIEWLGGRLAAKQSVLNLKGQKQSTAVMREWVILANEHGKPYYKNFKNDQPSLSISHSHGLALAIAVNEKECGLDIQKVSEATIRVKEKFCTEIEEEILSCLRLPDKTELGRLPAQTNLIPLKGVLKRVPSSGGDWAEPVRCSNRATGPTLLWSAKEALRKARGSHPLTGFLAMQLIEVEQPDSNCWIFKLRVNNEKYLVSTSIKNDFALALSVIY